MKRITVIIPCFNARDYIKTCIRSLENQTSKAFEIVIVDDCSTDGTYEFLIDYAKHSDYKTTILRNRVNLGPAKSREHGLKYAKSDYVAFCDCDDWYEEEFVESVLKKAGETNADILFFGYNTVLKTNSINKVTEHRLSVDDTIDDVKTALQLDVDSLCTILVKREIIDNVPFPDLRNGEDMALIPILITRSKNFGVIEKCLYNYLYRPGSASLSANSTIVDSLIKSFEYIEENISDDYYKECEYIGSKNLIYGALLNLFKFSFNIKQASIILSSFEHKYPNWYDNENIVHLPLYRRVFLWTVKRRVFVLTKLLAIIHKHLTNR